jgi:hypothetical protein
MTRLLLKLLNSSRTVGVSKHTFRRYENVDTHESDGGLQLCKDRDCVLPTSGTFMRITPAYVLVGLATTALLLTAFQKQSSLL